jgi:hypothetical protein
MFGAVDCPTGVHPPLINARGGPRLNVVIKGVRQVRASPWAVSLAWALVQSLKPKWLQGMNSCRCDLSGRELRGCHLGRRRGS